MYLFQELDLRIGIVIGTMILTLLNLTIPRRRTFALIVILVIKKMN